MAFIVGTFQIHVANGLLLDDVWLKTLEDFLFSLVCLDYNMLILQYNQKEYSMKIIQSFWSKLFHGNGGWFDFISIYPVK